MSITRIMASGLHPDFNAAVESHFAPVMAGWQEMLARAVERGDASRRHRADTVVNALVSPLFLAPLTRGASASPDTVDRLVDLVLDATRPSS